ncbi:unnamed protein product [Cuscuta campestris]|uniref:CCHC-type domain-containing protein n=1 Tax=Cuscuta campestris TaxID=132261 RepID=A0A484MV31_9ASTE|nr:unnamed protein product [Cuscuta campestris]
MRKGFLMRAHGLMIMQCYCALKATVGDNIRPADLNFLDIWVQVYGLPFGYTSKGVLEAVGNFLGRFIMVDDRNLTKPYQSFMRVRVSIDVRRPLKRRMKLTKRDGSTTWVTFKYERLGTFCYFCGILGHLEKHCASAVQSGMEAEAWPYDDNIRAGGKKKLAGIGAPWLRDMADRDITGRSSISAKADKSSLEGGMEGLITKRKRRNNDEMIVDMNITAHDAGLNDTADVTMEGYPYTWEWKKGTPDWVEERLDRAVVSLCWRDMFPRSRLVNKLSCCGRAFSDRIHLCGEKLEGWGKGKNGDTAEKISHLRGILERLRGVRSPAAMTERINITKEIDSLMDKNDCYWRQRAKQHWLSEGDRNTRFFHNYASHRRRKNYIRKLRDSNGNWHEGSNLTKLVFDFYSDLFVCAGPRDGQRLSFRRIRDFNVAMIGKQGWRLIVNPDSLVARVFKARYYSKGDFLNAGLGSSPSFVWRSILEGRNLIINGIGRRIGDGRDTLIWDTPWIWDKDNPFITSSKPPFCPNFRVSYLIDPETNAWKMDVVREWFSTEDAIRIQRTPVSLSRKDCWYWRAEAHGNYTVKSAYRRLCGEAAQLESFGQWNRLWGLPIIPKVKNCVWRCLRGVLPTAIALRAKGVDIEPNCRICGAPEESVEHVFLSCPFAQATWRLLHREIATGMHENFNNCLAAVFRSASAVGGAVTAAGIWAIWKARNQACWELKVVRPEVAADWAREVCVTRTSRDLKGGTMATSEGAGLQQLNRPDLLRCFVDAAMFEQEGFTSVAAALLDGAGTFIGGFNKLVTCPLVPRTSRDLKGGTMATSEGAGLQQLNRPDLLRCFVDAAMFEQEGFTSVAAALLDGAGTFIGGFNKLVTCPLVPRYVETFAIKEALSWLKEKNVHDVAVFSDCAQAVHALKNDVIEARSYLNTVEDDCKKLAYFFNYVNFFHIPRQSNLIAHTLARLAVNGCYEWHSIPPNDVLHLL